MTAEEQHEVGAQRHGEGSTCFRVEVGDDGIAHVVLSRPEALNTMVPAFWEELPALVTGLGDDPAVRCVVVSSTGRHFSAGMDLAVFAAGGLTDGRAETGRTRARLFQSVLRLQEAFTALERVRVPVLAAVQGGCIGGAVDLVTACDARYASADAFFVVQETNIGMVADVGTLQRLPKIIPEGVARELVYTGRRMPAAQAREVGLVNEVYDDHAALVAGVLETAREIAAKSPLVQWGNKEMLLYARDHSVADSLRHVAAWQTGMFQPADLTEALAARTEGRSPVYEPLAPPPAGLG
jgi:enoyl-CoA hydratase